MGFLYSHPLTTAALITALAYSISAAAIYLGPGVSLSPQNTDGKRTFANPAKGARAIQNATQEGVK